MYRNRLGFKWREILFHDPKKNCVRTLVLTISSRILVDREELKVIEKYRRFEQKAWPQALNLTHLRKVFGIWSLKLEYL